MEYSHSLNFVVSLKSCSRKTRQRIHSSAENQVNQPTILTIYRSLLPPRDFNSSLSSPIFLLFQTVWNVPTPLSIIALPATEQHTPMQNCATHRRRHVIAQLIISGNTELKIFSNKSLQQRFYFSPQSPPQPPNKDVQCYIFTCN